MSKITVDNLTVTYKSRKRGVVTALNDFNAVFEHGALSVILGYSGCGKTTLLKTIAGLKEYDGNIFYDGIDADELSFKARNLSYVSQNYSLYYHMTVFDNIAFPLNVAGAPREEVIERVMTIADELGLRVCLTRKPRQLSGGQQQRVALARALIKNPSLCLLDEPLSNLDAEQRVLTRGLIRKTLASHGCTTIYVTHDFTEAMALADKIYVMNDGKLVCCGEPKQVFASDDEIVRSLKGENSYDGIV